MSCAPAPEVLFCRNAFCPISAQPILPGLIPSQIEDFALSIPELREVHISQFLQLVVVPSEQQPSPPVCWLLPPVWYYWTNFECCLLLTGSGCPLASRDLNYHVLPMWWDHGVPAVVIPASAGDCTVWHIITALHQLFSCPLSASGPSTISVNCRMNDWVSW